MGASDTVRNLVRNGALVDPVPTQPVGLPRLVNTCWATPEVHFLTGTPVLLGIVNDECQLLAPDAVALYLALLFLHALGRHSFSSAIVDATCVLLATLLQLKGDRSKVQPRAQHCATEAVRVIIQRLQGLRPDYGGRITSALGAAVRCRNVYAARWGHASVAVGAGAPTSRCANDAADAVGEWVRAGEWAGFIALTKDKVQAAANGTAGRFADGSHPMFDVQYKPYFTSTMPPPPAYRRCRCCRPPLAADGSPNASNAGAYRGLRPTARRMLALRRCYRDGAAAVFRRGWWPPQYLVG